ncbi:hypothetical protein VU01_11774 [Candidatus Electrothrix marina]|uniref:DUF1439 domain-containing protein n=1 Tax=Candidatus Electrothrix marina TaxID=1859130 RepID=A0A3S3U844_9BACT|nr:hypothetical protein VT99_12482 [Candidatus Electrothrix marina]RWX51246.1 hypothetical protein VU01_11774 [Candidatus Electrothrix marina]
MIAPCRRQYIFLLILCTFYLITVPAKAGQTPPVSLTLPLATLHQALSSLLPLPVEQKKKNSNFRGTFVIDSISRLAVKQNVIALQGQLSGRNMAVNAQVGGQTIQIKLGQMVLPISCDIALRYDQKRKTLFLRPTFYNQAPQHDPAATALAPLLEGLNKEYTLPLNKLDPLVGKLGVTPIFVQLEPVDIRLNGDSLVFQFRPHAGKLDPTGTGRK